MFTLVIVIHVIVSVFLVLSVLLQAGKGASIGATFGGASSQTLFGTAGPAPLLAKITGICAGVFMLTSLYLTVLSGKAREESIMTGVPEVTAPAEKPAEAAPATEGQGQGLKPAPLVETEKPAGQAQ